MWKMWADGSSFWCSLCSLTCGPVQAARAAEPVCQTLSGALLPTMAPIRGFYAPAVLATLDPCVGRVAGAPVAGQYGPVHAARGPPDGPRAGSPEGPILPRPGARALRLAHGGGALISGIKLFQCGVLLGSGILSPCRFATPSRPTPGAVSV